jgi:hypothetical protein
MPPASNCPRCGRPSVPGNTFCAGCGSNLSSTSSGKGWKVFFAIFAIFAGLVWAGVIFTRTQPAPPLSAASQPQALSGQDVTPHSAQLEQVSPALTLTTAQHLSEAKRALVDGYKPNKDPQKAQWGEVGAAKWHLRSIGVTAPEYREAQDLLKEVARRERQIELVRRKAESTERSEETATAGAADDASGHASSAAASSSPASSSPSDSTAPRQSPPASTTGGGSASDYYTNSRGARVHRPIYSESGPPAGATAQCADGTYSFSQSRRGTCSHHGGVSRWL